MTNQEIFDKVAAHLLTQNARSYYEMSCRYRGPNGLRCAVGCLITDEAFKYELEGQSASNTMVKNALKKSLGMTRMTVKTVGLLMRLQSIHDCNTPESWEQELKNEAAHHGLQFNHTPTAKAE